MSDKPKAIKVRTKSGKIQRIAVSDISTHREWEDDDGEVEGTGIVLKGSGKQFTAMVETEKIDELFDLIDLT